MLIWNDVYKTPRKIIKNIVTVHQ